MGMVRIEVEGIPPGYHLLIPRGVTTEQEIEAFKHRIDRRVIVRTLVVLATETEEKTFLCPYLKEISRKQIEAAKESPVRRQKAEQAKIKKDVWAALKERLARRKK